jgi:anti-anti-sigma factor
MALRYLNVSPLAGGGFRIEGDLDVLSVPELEEFVEAHRDGAPLLLDLAGVSFIDSSGLRLLLGLRPHRDGRPALIIRNPSEPVRRLLALSIPDGVPEVEIRFDFDGAGPGAAHRLTELLRSSRRLVAVTARGHARATSNIQLARQIRTDVARCRSRRQSSGWTAGV